MISFLKRDWLTLFFVLLKFSIPFLFLNHEWELHRDELLYLEEGNHLSWGYLEVPLAIGFQAFLVHCMGSSFFAVKFFPALFGALTVLFLGKIIRELEGNIFSQLLAYTSFLLTAYLRINILFQPNALDMLLWTVCFWLIIRYIKKENGNDLLWLGLLFGIGLLNKYTTGIFIITVLAGFALTSYRKIFGEKKFYLATLIAFLVFLPNVIWQLQHNVPFLIHMKELNEDQLQQLKPLDFLKDQLLMNLPATLVWLAGLYSLLFSGWGKQFRMIAVIYFSLIALLLILHGKSYYSLGMYPVLFAFGAIHLSRVTERKKTKILRPVLMGIVLLAGIPIVPIALPCLPVTQTVKYCAGWKGTGILKWEDGEDHPLPQDYADMLGWKELTAKVSGVYTRLSIADKDRMFIYCDNYGLAGAICYYGDWYNLPPAQTANASFLLWIPTIKNVDYLLYVSPDKPGDMTYQHSRGIQLMDSIAHPLARERGTQIYLISHPDQWLIDSYISEAIAGEKKVFNIK